MSDINFLPEEFRKKEEKERLSLKRARQRQKIELSEALPLERRKPLSALLFWWRGFLAGIKRAWHSFFSRSSRLKIRKKESISVLKASEADSQGRLLGKKPDFMIGPGKKTVQKRQIEERWPGEEPGRFWRKIFQGDEFKPVRAEVHHEVTPQKKDIPQVKLAPLELQELKKDLTEQGKAEETAVTRTPRQHFWLKMKSIFTDFLERMKGRDQLNIEQEKEPEKPQKKKGALVNLMPLVIFLAGQAKERLVVLGLVNLVCIIIVGLIYLAFLIYPPQTVIEVQLLNQQIAQLEEPLSEFDKVRGAYNELEGRIKLASDLFVNHVYWTQFFILLENHTVPEVAYLSFGGDLDGAIHLSAVARDYYDVARQLLVLQKADDFIESIEINSASEPSVEGKAAASLVNFDINLKVNPKVFKKGER